MRLTDVPSYGIGIFKNDGSVVFVRPLEPWAAGNPTYNGRCYYSNPAGQVALANGITVGKKTPRLESLCREQDELFRFWSLKPDEVMPIECLIRDKLGIPL